LVGNNKVFRQIEHFNGNLDVHVHLVFANNKIPEENGKKEREDFEGAFFRADPAKTSV
jgi:hypothetical protein